MASRFFRTYLIFNQAEEEKGDEYPVKIACEEGWKLSRDNDTVPSELVPNGKIFDPTYNVLNAMGQKVFSFKILSLAPGRMPPAAVIREEGAKEGDFDE